MRLLAILFAALLFSASARADLAFVRALDLGDNNATSMSYTAAFDATGSNLLIVSITGDTIVGSDDIASVTYAGVSAQLATSLAGSPTGLHRKVYLYYLSNPATGSNNVVVTANNTHYLGPMAAVYSGAGSSGAIPGATAASLDSSANDTYASSITTAPDRAWVMLFANNGQGPPIPTCTLGATIRTYGVLYEDKAICDSNGPVTPPQSYSMTATIANSASFQAHLMASFGPDAGGLMMRGCCQ